MSDNREFQTFEELLGFHNSNSRSFDEEVVKVVQELQSVNDNLKKLVQEWVNVKTRGKETILKQGDDAAVGLIVLVQGNGLLFDEQSELEKVASLKVRLRLIINELLSKVQWLQTVNSTMRQIRMSAHNVFESREVPDETFLMIWNAGKAYFRFQEATYSLKKALEIIENTDFSPTIFHSDLCGPKFIPQLLQLSSEFTEKATKAAMDGMSSVGFTREKKYESYSATES